MKDSLPNVPETNRSMSWKISQWFSLTGMGMRKDSFSDSCRTQSTVASPRRSLKVSFSCDIDIFVFESAADFVPHEELWWGNEEMKISKKECVEQLQEVFRSNPSIRNGKPALQELLREM